MPNAEMKTLTIGDTTYVIVDEEARESVGDLSDLNTQDKNDLVAAINEVAADGGQVASVNGKTGVVVLAAADVGAATTGALTDEATARTAADAQLQGQITALGNGTPIPVETIAAMTDQTKAYLYTGSEPGESTGYWYSYDSTQDKFVPRGEYGASGGLTADIKSALLACFRNVAWINEDGQDFYGALDAALNPPANLSSITAVYTQSGAVDIADNIESLRQDLVVTAHYTGGTSEVVTAYNLSGTLTVGTSTITVSYGGKTATFDVTVTSSWMYIWDLTYSLTDKVSGRTAVASAGTGVDAPAITNDGLAFTAATQMVSFGDIDLTGKTIEIDVASMDFKGDTNAHIRFLCSGGNSVGYGPIIYHKTDGWNGYQFSAQTGGSAGWIGSWISEKNRNLFSGKTIKLVSGTDGSASLYVDGKLQKTRANVWYHAPYNLCIGGLPSYSQSSGDQCYDMVISAVRIKETEVA